MCKETDCRNCLCCYGDKCILPNIREVLDYIVACQEPTNEEKFKEIFGFPLYELHQLSAEEERDWSEKIYQKNNTKVD